MIDIAGGMVYTGGTVKDGGLSFKTSHVFTTQNLWAQMPSRTAVLDRISVTTRGHLCVKDNIMEIKAIETHRNGYRFRSRLEARWSVYFDCLGIAWSYEHEGFDLDQLGYYLPDFWFPVLDCFAEVKPGQFGAAEFEKCAALPKPCVILDTPYPLIVHGYYAAGVPDWSSYSHYLNNASYGRVLWPMSKNKDRLWFLLGEDVEDYFLDKTPEIAAKSARFEWGELS